MSTTNEPRQTDRLRKPPKIKPRTVLPVTVRCSSLNRVQRCPPSAVLPQVGTDLEAGAVGSAGHEHMQLRGLEGVEVAVEKIEEVCAQHGLDEIEAGFLKSRLMKFEWCPPDGSINEVRLVMLEDGTVERVTRKFAKLPGTLLSGQVDILWVTAEDGRPIAFDWRMVDGNPQPTAPPGSTLWVADYKFGKDIWVPPIEVNYQLNGYAVMAAKWTRATRVMPAVIFPGAGNGTWDTPKHPWRESELEAAELELRHILGQVQKENERQAARLELKRFSEGRQCTYCAARTRCPAQTAILKAIIDQPAPWGDKPLTAEECGKLARLKPQLDMLARKIDSALHAQVEFDGKPIPLGDGMVWGPNPQPTTVIDAEKARPILEEVLGEFASTAIETKITGAAINRACKELLESEGKTRGVAAIRRRIFGKMLDDEVQAAVKTTKIQWSAHRPPEPKPEPDAPELPPAGDYDDSEAVEAV